MSYLGRKKIIKTNWPIRASSVVTWSRSRHEHVLRCDHAAGSCRENWMKERTNGNESFPTHFVYSVWTHHVSALLSTLACVVFLYTVVYLLYTVLLREYIFFFLPFAFKHTRHFERTEISTVCSGLCTRSRPFLLHDGPLEWNNHDMFANWLQF